jgi:protein-S-isoprenylcysteine O-methyltransferase Ste14
MTAGVESLISTQLARKFALFVLILAAFAALALVGARYAAVHEPLESFGVFLMLACITGRCWCTLYIGGRKGAELVESGPYSISRNPLYFFTFLGSAGIGAQTGSLIVTAGFVFLTWLVFRMTVAREEAFLKGALGAPYARYLARVPRFLPNPRLWSGLETLEVNPGRVTLTFIDGLFFLMAIPLFEAVEWLQGAKIIPVLVHLP